ncbi:PmbA/TldA family metallopeptidase, partial [Laribacter hongkongensis]|uniref:PmbA/TldA family metallopeptidase n=1 Tax=Laribacter hongkongensis TaxID=168471 RepID=UPI0023D9350A
MTTESHLDIATGLLLTRNGLTPAALDQVFARLGQHDVDYADLYFQYTRQEGWSLDEGIVKSGSFNIDEGVGVRAVAGEKTAFAYSDEISLDALLSAADITRAIGRSGGDGRVQAHSRTTGHALFAPIDPIASLDSASKVALLNRLEQMARSMDPRVKQVMAGLAAEYDVMYVARRDGTHAADVRPLVRLSVTVIAEHQGRREQGSAGGGGRFDLAFFTDEVLHDYARKAVDQALVNLE